MFDNKFSTSDIWLQIILCFPDVIKQVEITVHNLIMWNVNNRKWHNCKDVGTFYVYEIQTTDYNHITFNVIVITKVEICE